LQREDLHPLDEAMALGRMHSDLGYSYAQIGERLGKSKGYVQNRMRLLQLGEDLQQLVAERSDTLKHVSEIARITDTKDRAALIEAVRTDALSFAMTQARVQALLEPPPQSVDSYSREYDSDRKHNRSSDGTIALLNVQERAVVAAVARKVQLWVVAPDQVSVADWEALEPLAQSLVTLLQAMNARGVK
jgi:ParB family transcriptional regulator, chromosome partitioning protein